MSLTLGVVLAFAAAVCLTGQALTIRLATREATSTHVLIVVLLINVVVLTPLAVVVPGEVGLTPTAVVAFVAAGMVGTLLGRAFLYGGIKRIGAARAEPLKASTPLHATVLAVLFLGEVVTPLQLVGIVLVVAGVANTAFLLVYYAALSVSRVSVVVPIMQTSPLLVALAAAAFLRGVERVTVPVVAGSAGVVVGAVLVTLFG